MHWTESPDYPVEISEPDKDGIVTITLNMPSYVYETLERKAKDKGVSMEMLLVSVLEEASRNGFDLNKQAGLK